MRDREITTTADYQHLLARISDAYTNGQQRALQAVNAQLTETYWQIGHHSNLVYMRLLYDQYPKGQKPSDLLSWSHHEELLRIEDPLERGFYEKQANWSLLLELAINANPRGLGYGG